MVSILLSIGCWWIQDWLSIGTTLRYVLDLIAQITEISTCMEDGGVVAQSEEVLYVTCTRF